MKSKWFPATRLTMNSWEYYSLKMSFNDFFHPENDDLNLVKFNKQIGTPNLLDELINRNDLENIFDNIFSVEKVRVYKPVSKVYDIPIKKYEIKKKEVAFLSANTWDVSGAGNYGFNSIWVNRNNFIFDNLDYQPENQINNLKELLDIV